MAAWYSGLMPYGYLLPSQIVIIALMAKVCVDFTRSRGLFFEPRRFFAGPWLWFGYAYLAAMIARAVLLWDRPIPIVFHWVLAAFVIRSASPIAGGWRHDHLRAHDARDRLPPRRGNGVAFVAAGKKPGVAEIPTFWALAFAALALAALLGGTWLACCKPNCYGRRPCSRPASRASPCWPGRHSPFLPERPERSCSCWRASSFLSTPP